MWKRRAPGCPASPPDASASVASEEIAPSKRQLLTLQDLSRKYVAPCEETLVYLTWGHMKKFRFPWLM
jgi:hypothetical protein